MSQPAPVQPSSDAARTPFARYLIVPVLLIAAYVAARWGIETVPQGSKTALFFALLPVPAFAFLIYSYLRGIRSMDELELRIQLEALALAFPVALLIVFTAGLLDLAGFHGKNDWDLPRLFPIVLAPYFFGIVRARRRYS
jgi:hypothetical protein